MLRARRCCKSLQRSTGRRACIGTLAPRGRDGEPVRLAAPWCAAGRACRSRRRPWVRFASRVAGGRVRRGRTRPPRSGSGRRSSRTPRQESPANAALRRPPERSEASPDRLLQGEQPGGRGSLSREAERPDLRHPSSLRRKEEGRRPTLLRGCPRRSRLLTRWTPPATGTSWALGSCPSQTTCKARLAEAGGSSLRTACFTSTNVLRGGSDTRKTGKMFDQRLATPHYPRRRSSSRYCTASATCSSRISAESSRSAMVRAILRTLS